MAAQVPMRRMVAVAMLALLLLMLLRREKTSLRSPLPSLPLEWRVPVGCDYSGFFVEAVCGFIPALLDAGLEVTLLTGECDANFLANSLLPHEAAAYKQAWVKENDRDAAITSKSVVIEHGNPCLMRKWTQRPLWVIARAMSEGELSRQEAACLGDSDEIWVPTSAHVSIFSRAGLDKRRLYAMPEIVDTSFFSPAQLSQSRESQIVGDDSCVPPPARAPVPGPHGSVSTAPPPPHACRAPFRFVSCFKFEFRKAPDCATTFSPPEITLCNAGPQLLLRAFWSEFSANDNVELLLKTYIPPWETHPPIQEWLRKVAASEFRRRSPDDLPRVIVREDPISRTEMREMYASSDAFVLPTRGEGWGLPIVEAMAMALPVVVTNVTGPREYLTMENSYPVQIEGTYPEGLAKPSLASLRAQMRSVYSDRVRAKKRGRRAREDMLALYSPERVASLVVARLRKIERKIERKIRWEEYKAARTHTSDTRLTAAQADSRRPGSTSSRSAHANLDDDSL